VPCALANGSTATLPCNSNSCGVVDCIGSFVVTGDCSVSCGGGTILSTFIVSTPASNGGVECLFGNGTTQSQTCNSNNCSQDCTFNGRSHLNGDYMCYKNRSLQCQFGFFQQVGSCCGSCSPPELVNCSHYNTSCATAFSNVLSEEVIFCGLDGNISSSSTLCYNGNGVHGCANNVQGTALENWIVTTALGSQSIGFTCPEN
jgi:hypothetical protein